MESMSAAFPPKHSLPGGEDIPEGDDSQRCPQGGEHLVSRLDRRLEQEKLGEKAQQGRDAPNGHGPDQKGACGPGHLPGQSTHTSHLSGARRLNDDPRHEKEHRLGQGVIDNKKESADQGERGPDPQAQQDVPHLAHTGIGQEALDVGLGERSTSPHDHGDGRQGQNPLLNVGTERDKDHTGDPEDTVRSHLDQDAGEDGTDRGRSAGVGIGQPEVERKH